MDETRSAIIKVRVTEAEKAEIEARAKATKSDVSKYVRERIVMGPRILTVNIPDPKPQVVDEERAAFMAKEVASIMEAGDNSEPYARALASQRWDAKRKK